MKPTRNAGVLGMVGHRPGTGLPLAVRPADSIRAFLKDNESQFLIERIAEIERLLRARTNEAVTSTERQGLASEIEELWRPVRQSLLLHLPRARDI